VISTAIQKIGPTPALIASYAVALASVFGLMVTLPEAAVFFFVLAIFGAVNLGSHYLYGIMRDE
jgi:hypothetical protein